MRPVQRRELLDLDAYERARPRIREEVMAEKARRRVHLDPCFTFLFENTDTVRYQIQEMLRAERIEDEEAIRHEVETYNGLLGGKGELGATLLVEIEDPAERPRLLRAWHALPEHLYALLPDGTRARPRCDPAQRGEDRLSSVQYLVFPVGGAPPLALGIDLPALCVEAPLSPRIRAALAEDLAKD
jgi:hypothetical protein